MATDVHPSAIIEQGAELDQGVSVGAYAYIGGQVKLGKGTVVMHHATVDGVTTMGESNEVHPYAYIGGKTHDLKYQGGMQRLQIGAHNVFREFTTVHCATSAEQLTVVGNHNNILSYSHIAHECVVGDHLVMSSHAALGGHVIVDDYANIGWGAGIHQFCRIGTRAMVGATSKVVQDVPPYVISDGNPAVARTINKVGLERAGYSKEEISLARRMFKAFFKDGLNRSQAVEWLRANEDIEHRVVKTFLDFTADSQRGLG